MDGRLQKMQRFNFAACTFVCKHPLRRKVVHWRAVSRSSAYRASREALRRILQQIFVFPHDGHDDSFS
jgi:hypothetical protein